MARDPEHQLRLQYAARPDQSKVTKDPASLLTLTLSELGLKTLVCSRTLIALVGVEVTVLLFLSGLRGFIGQTSRQNRAKHSYSIWQLSGQLP